MDDDYLITGFTVRDVKRRLLSWNGDSLRHYELAQLLGISTQELMRRQARGGKNAPPPPSEVVRTPSPVELWSTESIMEWLKS
jgi:hypothetical protein